MESRPDSEFQTSKGLKKSLEAGENEPLDKDSPIIHDPAIVYWSEKLDKQKVEPKPFRDDNRTIDIHIPQEVMDGDKTYRQYQHELDEKWRKRSKRVYFNSKEG